MGMERWFILTCILLLLACLLLGARKIKVVNEKREQEKDQRTRERALREQKRVSREQFEQRRTSREQMLKRKIDFITRADFPNGYAIKNELGVISSSCQMRSAAEEELKLKAAELGATGIIKLFFHTTHEKYCAGTGHKGNPYYKTRTATRWEGVAVIAEAHQKKDKDPEALRGSSSVRQLTQNSQKNKRLNDFGAIVIDGSNLIMSAPDIDIGVIAVSRFLKRLIKDEKDAHAFFDANIGYRVDNKLMSAKQIAVKLSVREENVSVVTGGIKADSFILLLSEEKNAFIVSNDKFQEYQDEYPWLKEEDRLAKFQYVGNLLLVPMLGMSIELK